MNETIITKQLLHSIERLEKLKTRLRNLEDLIMDEMSSIIRLGYVLISTTIQPPLPVLIQQTPLLVPVQSATKKTDKRSLPNPIKNLNIGVMLSYRHHKQAGYDANEARKRVYRSIIGTAVKNGVIADGERLPPQVIDKIDFGYQTYSEANKKAVESAKITVKN